MSELVRPEVEGEILYRVGMRFYELHKEWTTFDEDDLFSIWAYESNILVVHAMHAHVVETGKNIYVSFRLPKVGLENASLYRLGLRLYELYQEWTTFDANDVISIWEYGAHIRVVEEMNMQANETDECISLSFTLPKGQEI
jgi:hypothetical protein